MRILMTCIEYGKKIKEGELISANTEADIFRQHGHTVKLFCLESDMNVLNIFKYFFSRRGIKKVLKEVLDFKPDIVHFHSFFGSDLGRFVYEIKRHNIPIVFTLRNYKLICIRGKLLRKGKICTKCVKRIFPLQGIISRCYFNCSFVTNFKLQLQITIFKLMGTFHKIDVYIALTPFLKELFVNTSLQVPSGKFVVKPNTIAYDLKPSGPHNRKDFFLFVGRLSEEKGIQFLVKLFLDIPIPLHIVGDGYLKKELVETAANAPHIEFFGTQEASFVNEKLSQCRALIFPAIWYEPFGRVIMEAFASGTPVISSRFVSIVNHRYNGIVCQSFQPEEWKAAIQTFQNPSDETLKLYAGARETFKKKYNPELNYKMLLEIYKKCLRK